MQCSRGAPSPRVQTLREAGLTRPRWAARRRMSQRSARLPPLDNRTFALELIDVRHTGFPFRLSPLIDQGVEQVRNPSGVFRGARTDRIVLSLEGFKTQLHVGMIFLEPHRGAVFGNLGEPDVSRLRHP